MLGNIGNLFVVCMRQVPKDHLYHVLGVSDYCVMYRERVNFVKCLQWLPTGNLILLDGSVNFCETCVVREWEFLRLP